MLGPPAVCLCSGARVCQAVHDRRAAEGDDIDVRMQSELDPVTRREWDAMVRATPGTDVNQLTAWATVRSVVGYSARTSWR